MSSFDVDSEGNFTVVYERASTGSASHTDDLWKDTLKDVSVKVDAVVKGKIIPGTSSEPGRITFESGITATKHNKWMPNVNISLSSVQAVADSTNILVTGSWGPFSKEALVSQSTINFTQLDWKA